MTGPPSTGSSEVPGVSAGDTTPDGLPPPRPSAGSVPLVLRLKQTRISRPGMLPEDAERCRIEGRWEQLIEILLLSLDQTEDPPARARLFLEIADVFRDGLGDPAQALDGLLEAWDEDPSNDAIIAPMEELAAAQSRWAELVDQTEAMLAKESDTERAFILCERLFWWLAFELPRPDRAAVHAERMRAFDPTLAVVHLYQALVYGARGDARGELHELDRAALSARRPEDRARLHLLMAARYEDPRSPNPTEARKHFASAVQADPKSVAALRALAAVHVREGDAVSLAAVLEKHVEATRDLRERVAVLRALADLHEKHFLKPEVAAQKLAIAFALDPHDVEVLGALERCHRATRAWPELAAALEVASLSDDTAVQTVSLASLAEVKDARLDDPVGAIRAYERLLLLLPTDEEVLGHLARLTEKVGDWRAAASWRSRHAELASTAAEKARLHAAAGQLFAAPGRAPELARVHFEEAVACDPSHEAAWHALLWDARSSGDVPRLARYLAQRAETVEGPRQKGQLYVELAELRLTQLGDELGAIEAYVASSHADPTNDAAARALMEIYVGSQRWEDAAPLCTRVALSAERDGDTELLAFALAMSYRVALAERNYPRALTHAVSRFELRPALREAKRELVTAAYRLQDDSAILEAAWPAIDTVADDALELDPQAVAELATVLAQCNDSDRAEALFQAALLRDGLNVVALGGLSRLFAARGDFIAAGAMERRLAGAQETSEAKYNKLVEAADMYSVRASNWPLAVEAYEQASVLRPEDHQLLHKLLTGYQKLGRWQEVNRTLRKVSQTDADLGRKSKTVFAMAQIARDKLDDPASALGFFEEALDLDPTHLEAFERVVRLLTVRREWVALVQSYARMILRAQKTGDVRLEHALYHQLGLIYRDRLHDHGNAIQSFREATRLAPDNPIDQAILRELLALGGRVGEAVEVAAEQVARDPLSASAYVPLFDLLIRENVLDRAWCVASVMHHLGASTDAAEQLYRSYVPAPIASLRGSVGDAWTQILHPDLDLALTEIFELLAPIVSEAKLAQLPWRDRLGYPGATLVAGGQAAWIGDVIERSSRALGLPSPKVFVRAGAGPGIAVAWTRPPALAVSPTALDACPPAMRPFVFGKRVFELAPPLVIRSLCPSASELASLAGVASRLVQPRPGPTATADDALRSRLKRQELERLADAVHRSRGRTMDDVETWAQLADLSTSRAGLLLGSDLELARSALVREGQLASDLSAREQTKHLVTFAVSDTFAALRRAMGVTLQVAAAPI